MLLPLIELILQIAAAIAFLVYVVFVVKKEERSEKSDRMKKLGNNNIAIGIGIGFVFGALAGGVLSQWWGIRVLPYGCLLGMVSGMAMGRRRKIR